MIQLFNFIEKYVPINPEIRNTLELVVKREEYSKNNYILKAGDFCKKVWFVESGMVRKFFLNDGQEITTWIHVENQMITSLNSYFNNTPTDEYFIAAENSTLLSITAEQSTKLNQYPEMQKFSRVLVETEFSAIDCISKKFHLLSAKEKYKLLCNEAPEVIKRANLGHIASIMGITQETLSRIRKTP